MTTEPYASARRVFWVVDNGSSHRGQRSINRLESQWPTLRLVHLPNHASWLNHVEIQMATPFEWKLTKADLNALVTRITVHHSLTPAA